MESRFLRNGQATPKRHSLCHPGLNLLLYEKQDDGLTRCYRCLMDSTKKTVLIIEDNASLRDILVQFVKRAGYQPLQAETGDAALGWLSATRPDLVLLDLGLPDVTGESIIESLKANPRTQEIPIIVQTAFGRNERTDYALDLGADEILHKPITLRTVHAVLDKYLSRSAQNEPGPFSSRRLL
jgi:DNA-binding response OmpR family regulator